MLRQRIIFNVFIVCLILVGVYFTQKYQIKKDRAPDRELSRAVRDYRVEACIENFKLQFSEFSLNEANPKIYCDCYMNSVFELNIQPEEEEHFAETDDAKSLSKRCLESMKQ